MKKIICVLICAILLLSGCGKKQRSVHWGCKRQLLWDRRHRQRISAGLEDRSSNASVSCAHRSDMGG